MMCEKGKWKSQ